MLQTEGMSYYMQRKMNSQVYRIMLQNRVSGCSKENSLRNYRHEKSEVNIYGKMWATKSKWFCK